MAEVEKLLDDLISEAMDEVPNLAMGEYVRLVTLRLSQLAPFDPAVKGISQGTVRKRVERRMKVSDTV